jgi:hypothetical protein
MLRKNGSISVSVMKNSLTTPLLLLQNARNQEEKGKNSMKAFKIGFSIGLIFSVFPAFAQSVKSDFDTTYDFSKWKTYDFAPDQTQKTFLQNSLNEKRIKTEVESQLNANGFLKAGTGKPDFLISWAIAGGPVTTMESQNLPPVVVPAGRRGGPGAIVPRAAVPVPRRSFEATVMLDLLDPAANQLIWRGLATDAIDPAKPEKLIKKGVEKVIKQFMKDAGRK